MISYYETSYRCNCALIFHSRLRYSGRWHPDAPYICPVCTKEWWKLDNGTLTDQKPDKLNNDPYGRKFY